eukprot:6403706-Ditylum_brightwellii.AAC.1
MKIGARSLEFVNYLAGNRALPIMFYVTEKKEKLIPLDYQFYEVGTPEEWLQIIDAISQVVKGQDNQDSKADFILVKNLLRRDALQVFQNKEASQAEGDNLAFTKCLAAITEHAFPKKVYKMQKKYIWNIRKPLRLESCKWILRMIKLNDYL